MPVKQDLTGQRFGFLTVTGQTEPDEKGRRRWICLCDCGKETAVLPSNLKRSPNVSCGCKKRNELTGQKIGRLTVLGRSDRWATRGSRKRQLWECRCDCGRVTYKATDQLTNPDMSMCQVCAGAYSAQKARENGGYESGTQRTKLNTKTQESENRSGIRGVYLDGKTGKYRARIKFRGVTHNLGTFLTLEAAVKARSNAEQELFGAFLEGGE